MKPTALGLSPHCYSIRNKPGTLVVDCAIRPAGMSLRHRVARSTKTKRRLRCADRSYLEPNRALLPSGDGRQLKQPSSQHLGNVDVASLVSRHAFGIDFEDFVNNGAGVPVDKLKLVLSCPDNAAVR
jgi:hypothetical protein